MQRFSFTFIMLSLLVYSASTNASEESLQLHLKENKNSDHTQLDISSDVTAYPFQMHTLKHNPWSWSNVFELRNESGKVVSKGFRKIFTRYSFISLVGENGEKLGTIIQVPSKSGATSVTSNAAIIYEIKDEKDQLIATIETKLNETRFYLKRQDGSDLGYFEKLHPNWTKNGDQWKVSFSSPDAANFLDLRFPLFLAAFQTRDGYLGWRRRKILLNVETAVVKAAWVGLSVYVLSTLGESLGKKIRIEIGGEDPSMGMKTSHQQIQAILAERELSEASGETEIRKAYRQLRLKCHPDKAKDEEDRKLRAEKLIKLNDEYEKLIDFFGYGK